MAAAADRDQAVTLGAAACLHRKIPGAQAQRIAYNVTTINQAFTSTYPQAYSSSTSSQQLVAGAQTRWQNSLAGFQDAMRVQAGVVQNLDEATFKEIADAAKASCPVSKALTGTTITLDAALA